MKNHSKYRVLPFGNLPPLTDGTELREAQLAGALLAKRGEQEQFGVDVAFSVRVDPLILHFLDVATSRVKTSRNEIVNQIIKAGMEASWEVLSDAEREDFLAEYTSTEIKTRF